MAQYIENMVIHNANRLYYTLWLRKVVMYYFFYNIYIAMKKNGNDIIDARKRNGICDIKPYLLQAQY